MKNLCAVLLFVLAAVPADAADWPFSDEHRSRLAFVHPLVNYAIHPAWQRDWERGLQNSNGVQITTGSVSTDDFYTDLVVNVTEPLNDRFRFLYRGVWRDGLHWDRDQRQDWLGLEMGIGAGVAAQLQAHPAPDKEELDLLAGLMLHDATRERYLRLSARWDDFLWGKKNAENGSSVRETVSLQWEARGVWGAWEAFTTGRYGSPSERVFPAGDPADDVRTRRRDGGSTWRVRRLWSDDDFGGLEVSHYAFEASQEGGESFDYANEWVHLKGFGLFRIGGPWGLRPEIHSLRQWSRAAGIRTFDHRRDDFFPAVFVELHAPGRSTWELGYLATHHSWEHTIGDWTDDTSAYTDKIEFGWTYTFRPGARLQFSLSHEVDLDRFGGGNIMFQINF